MNICCLAIKSVKDSVTNVLDTICQIVRIPVDNGHIYNGQSFHTIFTRKLYFELYKTPSNLFLVYISHNFWYIDKVHTKFSNISNYLKFLIMIIFVISMPLLSYFKISMQNIIFLWTWFFKFTLREQTLRTLIFIYHIYQQSYSFQIFR